MTKSEEPSKKSKAANVEENDSVFEFLYTDFERIASFIAQFNDFGQLKEILQSKSAGRATGAGDVQKFTGNVGIAKGEAEISSDYTAHHDAASHRVYDGQWMAPLMFLDSVDQKGLLIQDAEKARIGQLVIFKGPLKIRDFESLSKIWHQPAIRALIETGGKEPQEPVNRHARRKSKASQTKGKAEEPSHIDVFFDLVNVLPHKVQAIVGKENIAWGILRAEDLRGDPSDFALKYGGEIPGEWAMLGILDAQPNETPLQNETSPVTEIDQICDYLNSHIEPITRQFLGRPSKAFGVTPLLIFRSVT